MNIKEVLQNSNIEKLESEILLAHILQVTRVYLYIHPERELSPQEYEKFCLYQEVRKQGMPIAYIIQEKEFWSLKIKVTKNTLIPRPETELLIEAVLEKFAKDQEYHFLELATGSGAISIALSKTYPKSYITASDISEKALLVAKENQHIHQLNNIKFIQSDWFDAIKKRIKKSQKFNAIICNPPYIPDNDPHLAQGDVRFEPRMALTSGETGLEAIAHIINHAKDYLLASGWIFLEHGYDQGESVANLLRRKGYYHVNTKKDLNNLPRVTFGAISDVQLPLSSN